jgi:hypothetical protein
MLQESNLEIGSYMSTGSSAPRMATHKPTAKRYVFKKNRGNLPQVINEYIANQVYKLAGVNVPEVFLVKNAEVIKGLAIEYIEGYNLKDYSRLIELDTLNIIRNRLQQDYVIHALCGNWDINNSENYLVPVNIEGVANIDNIYVLDLGGAFFFRAMGATKSKKQFPNTNVPNLKSLKNFSRGSYLHLYDTVEKATICSRWAGVDKEAIKNYLRSSEVSALLEQIGYPNLPEVIEGRILAIDRFCAEDIVTGGRRRKTRKIKRKY